ncbi:MAG: guanylate kinase [Chitinophagaceae bacterium]|nr:guanylate kinase [Chitinophagaceae bacterium]
MNYKKLVILTAPSGAGKTSITRYLMKVFPKLEFSVSAATRKPRVDEKDGKDYYFITPEEFQQKIRNKEFAEWEMVYEGKYYGTLKSELERIWGQNKIPVLDIDVQGAIHVKTQYPINTLSMFIEPPSINELKKRLESRGSETAESLQARINKSAYELTFKKHFENVIVNENFDVACGQAEAILKRFLDN